MSATSPAVDAPNLPAATLLTDRAIVRLSGDDVAGFLQSLLSNDVAGPLPCYAALLSPQGKCQFDMLVWADPAGGADMLIDVERARADMLVRKLTLYRLRRSIQIGVDDSIGVHWALEGVAGAKHDPRLAALGHRWLAENPDGDAPPSCNINANAAWRVHRLSLGVAEGMAELGDASLLWLECNAAELHGVSFTKGCYVGQENTARMNWRQKVNRRLVVLPIADADAKRQLFAYVDLGLTLDHRRVEDIPPHGWRDWMREGAL